MSLTPAYGETPLEGEEFDALLPAIRELLGEPVTKAAVYDLEQAFQLVTVERLLPRVLDGSLELDELLTDHFLRDLHRQLYGEIWIWGGLQRRREINIGVAPELIAVSLRDCFDNLRFRWSQTDQLSARALGIAVHAEAVRIHPFADGNGRSTRLIADLVYVAAQTTDVVFEYDWDVDKVRYVELLREYDAHRNSDDLAEFIEVRPTV